MKNLILAILISSSFHSFAGDIICANKEAREYGAKVLSAQLLQHQQAAVDGTELFAEKVIISDEVVKIQPFLNTVSDLEEAIFKTKEFKRLKDLGWAVSWTLYANLPKQVKPETLLTEVFCK